MKKLFFIMAAMFVAVSFSACSDDDDESVSKAPTPQKWVKQMKFYDDGYPSTETITYDSENRVKSFDSWEFSYNGNSLIVKDGGDETERLNYNCKLNSAGYVTEITAETTYSSMDDVDRFYYKLEYDKNGYLKRVEERNDYNESGVSVSECTWRDGNLVEFTITDHNEDGTDVTTGKISYSKTATPINIDLLYLDSSDFLDVYPLNLLGFCGRQSAKLPDKITYDGESDDCGVYTLNDDGTVARIDGGSWSYELIY